MKVKCTANGKLWYEEKKLFGFIKYIKKSSGPKFNDILTVDNEHYSEGEKGFHFVEWPGDNEWFSAKWFIPIEETFESVTFKEIKEKASVN